MVVNNFLTHPTSVIDEDCRIGKGTRIAHFSHIMANCVIGNDCLIGHNVVVSSGVVLGNNVKIQDNVCISAGVTCEDDVFLGPSVVFTSSPNPRSAVNRRNPFLRTVVGQGASIGANSTLICGNDVGAYAMIGAGSVVTRSIPPYALMIGNPARFSGWVSEYGNRLLFDANNLAVCPESGQVYHFDQKQVTRLS